MTIHHHTKFDCKRLSGSRDNVWTKSGHMDTVISIHPIPTFVMVGGGGWGGGGWWCIGEGMCNKTTTKNPQWNLHRSKISVLKIK